MFSKLFSKNNYADVMGIDLGTTFTAVGVFNIKDHKVEIVPNDGKTKDEEPSDDKTKDDNKRKSAGNLIASCVSWSDKKRKILIGNEARSNLAFEPEKTVINAKRLIGRNMEEIPELNKYENGHFKNINLYFPFKIINNDNKPMITIEYRNKKVQLSPEDIGKIILDEIKKIVKNYTKKPIDKAVITVPAYFNNQQREATKRAAELAKIEVIKVINEPMAAAIAYVWKERAQKDEKKGSVDNYNNKNMLVFDLGGGTLEISICEIKSNKIRVKSKCGNTNLGGEDLNTNILNYVLNDMKGNDMDKSIQEKIENFDEITIRRFLNLIEKVKKRLSFCKEYQLNVGAIDANIDLKYKNLFNRDIFNVICNSEFNECIDLTKKAIKDSKLNIETINDVVLVGGSTRIVRVKELLAELFKNIKLDATLEPDEAIAYGATVHAFQILNKTGEELVLIDTVPLSLGIELQGGIMHKVIPKNTPYPIERDSYYSTAYDWQTSCSIKVFEGERKFTQDNHFLGQFYLTGITPMLKKKPRIKNTYSIDHNGIFSITSIEKNSSISNKIVIDSEMYQLSENKIEDMLEDADINSNQDQKELSITVEMLALHDVYYKFRKALNKSLEKDVIDSAKFEELNQLLNNSVKDIKKSTKMEENQIMEKRMDLEALAKQNGINIEDIESETNDNMNEFFSFSNNPKNYDQISLNQDSSNSDIELDNDEWINI